MNLSWLDRWRIKLIDILKHPWRSLVSLLAAIGGLIVWLWNLLGTATLWLLRKLRELVHLSLWKLFKGLVYAAIAAAVLLFVATIILINYRSTKVADFPPVDERVYISQGWGWTGGQNEPLRQLFYYTPQGAGLKDIRYSWFVNLEVPWGKTKFADPARMSAYGFLVDNSPTPLNPFRLPVGFSSHYDPRFGEHALDISCAACHTGELAVIKNGKRYGLRVDGDGAMHSFTSMHLGAFAPELLVSMSMTYLNPFKFHRFAHAVLGPAYQQGFWKLHGDLRHVIWGLIKQSINDQGRHLYPTEEGPGRVDALARIGNTVFGDELSPVNYKVGNAPVRYPPLWDIWKFNYVQYNASVRQPMTRNSSESLGVGATAELLNPFGGPIPREDRFNTSVMMDNLSELETALWSLEPPRWSEDCLGKIDWEKAKKGRELFEATCRHCHGPFPASEPIKEWFAVLKTPGHRDKVIKNWQEFLNTVYGVPNQGETPVTPTPPPPAPEGLIGIYLPQHRAQSSEGDTGPTLFEPPAPLVEPHHEELEELRAHEVQSPYPRATSPVPKISPNYEFPLWMMHPLTVEDIGTDPTAAVNFIEKQIDVTKLGFRPAVEQEGMRTLLQHDLNDETDAFAKEILRLSGVRDQSGEIRKLTVEARQKLRSQARDQANKRERQRSAEPAGQTDQDKAELDSDIATFEDLISAGPSRVDSFVASMDLSKLNTGVALRMIVFHARMRFYAQRRYSQSERDELNGFGELDVPVPLPQYKPRPLAGIWAAGPFLHNGSVPTIYQLLLPADQRDKKFFIGTRDFDPVNLGFSTDAPSKNGFWLDTSITGNSNLGHEFRKGYIKWESGMAPQYGVIGPELTEEERRDIIEYLKVHRDDHKIDPNKDLDGYLREGLDDKNVCQ